MAVPQRATEKTRWQRLHLQLRSGQVHNGKRVGAHGIHHLRNGSDFGVLEGILENRRRCRQDTHSQNTSVQYSLFTSAQRTSRACLKGQQGSIIALSSLCGLKEFCHLVLHMSHPSLFSHMPFTTSTSSSSFTLLSTTQEHAAQSVQQEQLREHPVHHEHLQAP